MPDGDTGAAGTAGAAAAALADVREALTEAAERLRTGGARDEALASFVPARRKLLVDRRARMVPLGRVWRLGAFLLGHDGALYAVGSVTRATDPKHPGYQSVSAETRRAHRTAAFKGPFAPGETVNFDATVIPLDADSWGASDGPLVLGAAGAMVRWSAGAEPVGFRAYIRERVDLLVRPPDGS